MKYKLIERANPQDRTKVKMVCQPRKRWPDYTT